MWPAWPHRLVAQDAGLSSRKQGFDPPWGYWSKPALISLPRPAGGIASSKTPGPPLPHCASVGLFSSEGLVRT
jgi:hypothetical protein